MIKDILIWVTIAILYVIAWCGIDFEKRITALEQQQCSTVEIFVEKSYDRNTGTYHYEVVGKGEVK